MEDYGLISSDPPWKWVVQKPCFVRWPKGKEGGEPNLGQLSPVNSTSRLTVNIGRRFDELLIALHLPISSRNSKRPRDYFVVIPCDFETDNVDKTFAPAQADEELKSAGLGDCKSFRIPFRRSIPCDVIMPRDKRRDPVQGTPKELLKRLRSLSEATSFEVFFRFDTYAQLELCDIFELLAEKKLKTPTLLLGSMYRNHGGAMNLWHHQGLDLEVQSKRGGFHPETHQQDMSIPPPYTRDNITSPDLSEPLLDVQVPCSDAAIGPVARNTTSEDEGVPETPFWARMQRILDYQSPSANYRRKDQYKRVASVDPLPDTRQEKRIRAYRSPSIGPLRWKASAGVIVDASGPVELNQVTTMISHGVDSATSPEESSWRPFASTPASLPLDWSADKTFAMHHDVDSPFDKAEEIAHWLYSAWKVLPSAHHKLRTQLLALGVADDANTFAQLRVDCSTKLAFAAALASKQEPNKPLLTETSDAEEQVREVVEWANGVRPDADTVLVYDLAALARAAIEVADSVSEKEEKMRVFLVHKARCIAFACGLGRAVATV